ncbi:MAG: hypothetical protein P8R42_10360 [Candidatus Binatia bacterium]|nr:hypothetical protein [Candidatus Binatia bacterium]
MRRPARSVVALPVLIALLSPGWIPEATAHDATVGISGRAITVDTRREPAKHKLLFKSVKEIALFPLHDPATTGSAVLVRWTGVGGAGAGRTERIELDPGSWKGLGNPAGSKGYKYSDKTMSAGGVRSVTFKPGASGGLLKILAKGENYSWELDGPNDEVWVHFQVEDEWYCAEMGGDVKKNEDGYYKAGKALAPAGGCPDQTCGNGVLELGEECDDGNLDDADTCANDCTDAVDPECPHGEFDSTFEAIQSVVFEGYGCADGICHDAIAPQGGLDLTAGSAYANLIGVSSLISPTNYRVVPGEPPLSVLYDKLQAGTHSTLPAFGGSPMPSGGAPLTADHLQAVWEWIRGGAPEDLSVEGTAELLATCLPDPEPLVIPVPDPPGAGVGVQFRQTPWDLPATSEDEICMATYYNLVGTGLVPVSEQVDCAVTTHNPTGKCFRYHKTVLAQDPQSHHSLISMFGGTLPLTHSNWGTWTLKFQDQTNPLEGTTCDPSTVDPTTGYNANCSSRVVSGITCSSLGGGVGLGSGNFGGSQEPYVAKEFADGVYALHPMAGIIMWNSHAFNLSPFDSTMSQYLNMELAGPLDLLYTAKAIFQANDIFVMGFGSGGIPAFETREYCSTYTPPRYATVFDLGSHTHRTGVHFRIWGPPNSSCSAGGTCAPRGDTPLYQSTDYSDPLALDVDMYLPGGSNNRRFLFCSRYDNGSTPSSPEVLRHPNNAGIGCVGRSCFNAPNQGNSCSVDSQCDSSSGAGDGECDACAVTGGFATLNEMFIMTGTYY